MEFDEYDPNEWEGTITMDIHGLRLLYDHFCYAIETWPGAPRRPCIEQEMLWSLRDQTFSMLMEYNFSNNTAEKD